MPRAAPPPEKASTTPVARPGCGRSQPLPRPARSHPLRPSPDGPESGHQPTIRPGGSDARCLHRLHHRQDAELRPDGRTPGTTENNKMHREGAALLIGDDRPHFGPAANGQKCRMRAVPPAVPSDHRRFREGLPIQRTPEPGGPGGGVGLHRGQAGRRQRGEPTAHGRGEAITLACRVESVGDGYPGAIDGGVCPSGHEGMHGPQPQCPARRACDQANGVSGASARSAGPRATRT